MCLAQCVWLCRLIFHKFGVPDSGHKRRDVQLDSLKCYAIHVHRFRLSSFALSFVCVD